MSSPSCLGRQSRARPLDRGDLARFLDVLVDIEDRLASQAKRLDEIEEMLRGTSEADPEPPQFHHRGPDRGAPAWSSK